MKRNFKRNLSVIIFVFALALYHVLPTCLYYSRPLNKKIEGRESHKIIERLTQQVADARNDLTVRVKRILSQHSGSSKCAFPFSRRCGSFY